jgi:hypothetical protein
MATLTPPAPLPLAGSSTPTVADLIARFDEILARRILLSPTPGTATVDDVIAIHDRENRLCELVDGVLVEKTMGLRESVFACVLSSSGISTRPIERSGFTPVRKTSPRSTNPARWKAETSSLAFGSTSGNGSPGPKIRSVGLELRDLRQYSSRSTRIDIRSNAAGSRSGWPDSRLEPRRGRPMMPPKPFAVWIPFAFSMLLGVIVMVANLWGYSHGGTSDAGMPAFFCFLPMAFLYAAAYQRQTAIYVKTLEDRIKILEAGEASA